MNSIDNKSYNIREKRLEMQRSALNILMKSDVAHKQKPLNINHEKSSNMDSAIISEESKKLYLNGSQSYENTYTLDFTVGVVGLREGIYDFEDGTLLPLSSIKKVDSSMVKDLQAPNNVLSFSTNTYYNYTDLEGRDYVFASSKAGFSLAQSEQALGNYTNEQGQMAVRTGLFISALIHGDYGACLDDEYAFFPNSEKKQILNNLGITTGKFSFSVDGKISSTFYLSENGTIFSDDQISSNRTSLANSNLFDFGYTAEDTFIVDGQEFHLDESGRLIFPDNLGMHIKVIRGSEEKDN